MGNHADLVDSYARVIALCVRASICARLLHRFPPGRALSGAVAVEAFDQSQGTECESAEWRTAAAPLSQELVPL